MAYLPKGGVSQAADTVTPTAGQAGSGQNDESTSVTENVDQASFVDAVLALDYNFIQAKPLLVPSKVRNAAINDVYGREGAVNPFEDGDLTVTNIWSNPNIASPGFRGAEKLTIGGRKVNYRQSSGYRPARVQWSEEDGAQTWVSSYLLDKDALVAAATSLLVDGEIDSGGLDLLGSDIPSTISWSVFPRGATMYQYGGERRPSPSPSIVPEADITLVAVEMGYGANEDHQSLLATALTLGSDDPTVVQPASPVSLESPGGIEVSAYSVAINSTRLRFNAGFGPVTMTLSGNSIRKDPNAEAWLDMVDNVRLATDEEIAELTARGQAELGTDF